MNSFKMNSFAVCFLILSNSVFENSGSKSLRSGATRATLDEFGNEIPCGVYNLKLQSKIVYGPQTKENEFTFLITIQKKLGKNYEHICGGIIVNKDYILTAAHCTHGFDQKELRIQAGKFNLKRSEPHEQTKGIEEIFEKDYIEKDWINDIALIKLSSPLKLEMGYVTPGCIPKGDEKFDNICEATGWGRMWKRGTLPDRPRKLKLPLVEWETCVRLYHSGYNKTEITRRVICTLAEKPKDICQGDSGGPVMCTIGGDDSKRYTCGLVSYHLGCSSGYPSIHTKVSSFYDWIKGIAGV